MELRWTADAIEDREAIYHYIQAANPLAALDLDDLIEAMASHLVEHPSMGKVGRVSGTREMVAHPNYVLIYQVAGDTVWILRVLHATRRRTEKQELEALRREIQKGLDSGISDRTPDEIIADAKGRRGE